MQKWDEQSKKKKKDINTIIDDDINDLVLYFLRASKLEIPWYSLA